MGVFSRLSDIINSNLNAMLDKAEDPEKIVRLIIQEMEDTLVEVRSRAARAIADKKEVERKKAEFIGRVNEWESKAELAIAKGRDDLAKGAIAAKRKAQEMVDHRRMRKPRISPTQGRRHERMAHGQALDMGLIEHNPLGRNAGRPPLANIACRLRRIE